MAENYVHNISTMGVSWSLDSLIEMANRKTGKEIIVGLFKKVFTIALSKQKGSKTLRGTNHCTGTGGFNMQLFFQLPKENVLY